MPKPEILPQYRTFWPRLLAAVIDGLVFMPLGIANKPLSLPTLSGTVLISWAIFYFVFTSAYVILMHNWFGQTIGKMVMRVSVVDVSEMRLPTLWQAFLRDVGDIFLGGVPLVYFIYLVSNHRYFGHQQMTGVLGQFFSTGGSVWSVLEILTMWFSNKRRALHDVIAGTVVVREWRHTARGLVRRWRGRVDPRTGEPFLGGG